MTPHNSWPPLSLIQYAAQRAVLMPEGFVIPAIWGRVSTFGGPNDTGVTEEETGAITGVRLRDLDPEGRYCAMRWEYIQGPFSRKPFDVAADEAKLFLRDKRVMVYGPSGKEALLIKEVLAPVDWGPHRDTGRVLDISPGAATRLGLKTDDYAVVHWP